MKKAIIYLSMFAFVLSLFSCKKDSTTPTKKEILTGSTWKTTGKTVSPAIVIPIDTLGHTASITDVSVFDSDTVKNYGYKFNSDGSFALLSIDNKSFVGTTWKFNTDETEIDLGMPLGVNYSLATPVMKIEIPIYIQNITVVSIVSGKFTATVPLVYNKTNYTVTLVFQPR